MSASDAKHTLGLTLTADLATGFRNPSGDRFDDGSIPLTRSEVVRAVVVLLSDSRATAIRCCCGPEWMRETSTPAASRAIFQISAEVLGGLGPWLTTPKRLRVHGPCTRLADASQRAVGLIGDKFRELAFVRTRQPDSTKIIYSQ